MSKNPTFTQEWFDERQKERIAKMPLRIPAIAFPEKPKPSSLCLSIVGQIRGGKNNIIVTRSGHRFPNPTWSKWRDDAVAEIKKQLPSNFRTITEPCLIRMDYVAQDMRRRDMPAIVDSVFHVLEKAGVVKDDTLLWVSESSRGYDKNSPRCDIWFL